MKFSSVSQHAMGENIVPNCPDLSLNNISKSNTGADTGIFAGKGPTLGTDLEIWLGGVGKCADRRLVPMRAAAGGSPENLRCSEKRFQANPDGTILAQNDIELLCEARASLTTCRIILRSEIEVNSVHRIFRANFFAMVHKFVDTTP
jgi:hypothetical protein